MGHFDLLTGAEVGGHSPLPDLPRTVGARSSRPSSSSTRRLLPGSLRRTKVVTGLTSARRAQAGKKNAWDSTPGGIAEGQVDAAI